MIVFRYKTYSVYDCHSILENMEIPGEKYTSEELSNEGSRIVWKGDKFIGIFHPEEQQMELYATKNTNSINFFINKYDKLDWDSWSLVKTKRW